MSSTDAPAAIKVRAVSTAGRKQQGRRSAVGTWRQTGEADLPIDASGQLPDGAQFEGPQGLRALLLERGDQFVGIVTEKLLSYALGRSSEFFGRPAVRAIAREVVVTDYRWSSIIVGIVKSTPFTMRRAKP